MGVLEGDAKCPGPRRVGVWGVEISPPTCGPPRAASREEYLLVASISRRCESLLARNGDGASTTLLFQRSVAIDSLLAMMDGLMFPVCVMA